MGNFTNLLKTFSPDPNQRGKQFEHFVKWFLENDPQWSTQVDQVWLWDEYPNNWGRDCGIDLIFRHKNGENWAVQAKCYASTTSITKADIDSFISESNREGIHKRLLVATTDLIGANAKQVCDAQDKTVIRFLLSNFEDAEIDYPDTFEDLYKGKQKEKPIPKKHQLEAIEAIKKGFKEVDRGQLIMACGTGKTFTTLWIKEALQSESTLILLPSLGLLSQTLHEWTAAKNQDFSVLCVCSDDSVGKKGGDEAVHDIADLAFPVTSDPLQIAAFLTRPGPKVVFSTYQSSILIADAQSNQRVPAFSLAIADEAHRCAGDKTGNFATILDSQRIRAVKRLFTTATPRTYSTALKKGAAERGIEIVGMDNEELFGPQLYALNFGDAIKLGLLTDYRVVIVGVDSPMIASYIENRDFVKTETDIESDAETLAAQIAILKAMKDFDLHRMISFHSRVKRAEDFAKNLKKVAAWIGEKHRPSGELIADYVSGEMPTFSRRQKLSLLRSIQGTQRALLTNSRCLSEGVDVPSLDGVAFIDPRASQVDIIQAVGRAIRLSPNKKAGTILLPVFIGNGDNPEAVLAESNFKPIWDVLNALRSHDDVLADELDQMRVSMGKRGSTNVQGGFCKIEIDLPLIVDDSFREAINTRLVESTTESWEFWFGLLSDYAQQNGNCLVPQNYKTPNGYKLGNWVINQRQNFSILSKRYIDRLESLPNWSWNTRDDQWEFGYEELKKYADLHRTCNVPIRYKSESGFKLGIWVTVSRSRRGLSPVRDKKLESLPGWIWDIKGMQWDEGLSSLQNFYDENGHCLVPDSYVTKDGYQLGKWIGRQRTKYKQLSEYRKSKLESFPGWTWNARENAWLEAFDHLQKYLKINGNTLVPQQYYTPEGFALGAWVGKQRSKKSDLTKEKQDALESLEGWSWNPHQEAWNHGFDHLKVYVSTNKDASVPKGYVTNSGFKLGAWVSKQRSKRLSLIPEQTSALESLDGWSWDPHEEAWNRGFDNLKFYVSLHGDAKVPRDYATESGFRLGEWVKKQRLNRKKISITRAQMLESLPGWLWQIRH